MRKLLLCAAALGFLACVPVSAQNNDHRGDKHDAAASNPGRAAPGLRQNDKGHAVVPQNGRTMPGGTQAKPAAVHRDINNGPAAQPARTRGNQNPPARATANGARNNNGWSGNTQGRQPAIKSQQRDQEWSGNTAGHRPDFNSMRQNMQATKRFHGGSYRAPQGYQYRHWSFGERLPRGYYDRNYWIGDFLMFGLFAPPSDLVWVRVGNDALLIDRESGEIVQVRYGVFY
jgi:Ni/Co efflux regulator RcnB